MQTYGACYLGGCVFGEQQLAAAYPIAAAVSLSEALGGIPGTIVGLGFVGVRLGATPVWRCLKLGIFISGSV